jgi:hypothetical protein
MISQVFFSSGFRKVDVSIVAASREDAPGSRWPAVSVADGVRSFTPRRATLK